MSKPQARQAGRLSLQHAKNGGVRGIFGDAAQLHDVSIRTAASAVFKLLVQAFPEFVFRHRSSLSKAEIHQKLTTIDPRLGQTLYLERSSIKPDGGIVEVKDAEQQWRVVLIGEAKHQGNDYESIQKGTKVGTGGDQDFMAAGNAIERMHKNVNEMRNFMLAESHFPYVVFLQGSNFAIEDEDIRAPGGRIVRLKHNAGNLNRIDRVTAANYGMSLSTNLCRNVKVDVTSRSTFLQAVSLYCRRAPWTLAEMTERMVEVAETSLDVLWDELPNT